MASNVTTIADAENYNMHRTQVLNYLQMACSMAHLFLLLFIVLNTLRLVRRTLRHLARAHRIIKAFPMNLDRQAGVQVAQVQRPNGRNGVDTLRVYFVNPFDGNGN